MSTKKIGVVGCGTMGAGIAIVMARAGYTTIVQEMNEERIRDGFQRIKSFFDSGVKRGKLTENQKEQFLNNVQMTMHSENLKDCDYVVEAVFEDVEIKRNLFKSLNT